jgi:hypothetical protein
VPTDVNSLKTNLLSLLGASLSVDGWEDGVLAEAIAQGAADANVWLPPVEASFSIVTAGADQDINTLAPLQVLAVGYPWIATSSWRDAAVPWRMTAPGVVTLNVLATVGQSLRVRYRKAYTVSGIGGATETTLPPAVERLLLLAAASHAYLIRYRQLSRRPSTAPSDLQSCKELADAYRRQFEQLVAGGSSEHAPAWPGIGL